MGSLRSLSRKEMVEPVIWYSSLLPADTTTIMVYRGRNKDYESTPSGIYHRKGDLVTVEDRQIIEEELKTYPRFHYVEYAPLEQFCKFGCGKHYKRQGRLVQHEDICSANPRHRACQSCRYEAYDILTHWNTGYPRRGRFCTNPVIDMLDDFPEDRPLFPSRSDCPRWERRGK
jgi:hypothetical protein